MNEYQITKYFNSFVVYIYMYIYLQHWVGYE